MKVKKMYQSFQVAADALAIGKNSASLFEAEFGLESGIGDAHTYNVKMKESGLNEFGTFNCLVTIKIKKIK